MRGAMRKHRFRRFTPLGSLLYLSRSIRKVDSESLRLQWASRLENNIVPGPLSLTGLQQQARSHALPYSWCPRAQHVAQMFPECPLCTMYATLRNASSVLTVRTDCHTLGAKTSPEKPSPNLFPNMSGFTEEGSEAQKDGNVFCKPILVATLFTYAEALSSIGFISRVCWHARSCVPRRNNNVNAHLAGRWFDGEACNAQKNGNNIS